MDATTLNQKIRDFDLKIAGLEALRSERKDRVTEIENDIELLTKETDLLEKVEATLQAVSSKVLGQSTKTIDQLVTIGLKSVFTDQNLEFKTVIDKYRGKTSIRFELFESGETAPLMDSYGGGVLAIIGVLLRVTSIIVLKKKRFLLLDESLSHLSEQYISAASALMKRICSDLDFVILMVTHEPLFAEHADKHYIAKKGAGGTVFDEQNVTKSNTQAVSA